MQRFTPHSKGILYIFLSFILVFSILVSEARPSDAFFEKKETSYVITIYNDLNGLPTGEANTILQTSDGYIWIGSYGGLIRFDGSQFTNYSLNGSIDSSSIRSLYEDSKGRLWIGTNDKGVVLLENNEFIHIASPDDYSFLCIRDFTETSDGKIYLASSSGIAYIEDNQVVPIQDPAVYEQTVYSLDTDCYDRIWFAMVADQGGVLDKNHKVNIYSSEAFFEAEKIYSVACYGDKVYWGSNSNIYAEVTLNGEAISPIEFETTYHDTGAVSTHNKINISEDGDILISGLTGFYMKTHNGVEMEFDEEDAATSVNCAYKDYEGNIWLASSSTGVTKYTEGYFYNTNLNSGLEDTALNAITKANDMYFIGSDDRLYICDSNWNQITNELTDMLEGVRVRHVITDSKGTVWLATYAGVYNYNPKTEKIVSYTTENGLINDRARVLLELQDGNIAVGTQAGISFIGNNKVLENYDHEDGLVNPAILCMLQAEDGTLLCGSDGDGIYAIKEHTITNHGFNEGLAEGVVLRMIKNKDEAGYFISAGSSLYYWNDVENTFTKLTNWDKGAGSVFDMYDKNGYIWILQNKGVLAVNKEQLIHDIPAETITYSFTHGLTGSLNANTWNYLEDDENLYMVTRNGVCIFYFTEIKNSDPKGIISSVIVDDVMYDNPTKLHLKSNANRITINFSELSFSGTSTLKMSYILEGFDTKKTMVATEHSQSISYTNLPGGDYTFILDIYDSHNPNVKERYTVEIHKDKKFTEYQLFWIILVLIMLLVTGLIIYYISRRKIRKLQQHKKEYQDILDQSLKTFAKTIDAKDTYTNGHSLRVAMYSRELAKRLGLSEWEQERIYYVAMLHDIGKIGIPDNILNKPGKLTDEEMRIIQTHPAIGGEILKDFTALPNISEGAKYHHERYDGKGYCEGKAGEDIPFVARIIGVADTYDAMSSDRCYRKALSTDIIISELKKGIGTQLDPDIVKIMLEMIEEGSVPYTI